MKVEEVVTSLKRGINRFFFDLGNKNKHLLNIDWDSGGEAISLVYKWLYVVYYEQQE